MKRIFLVLAILIGFAGCVTTGSQHTYGNFGMSTETYNPGTGERTLSMDFYKFAIPEGLPDFTEFMDIPYELYVGTYLYLVAFPLNEKNTDAMDLYYGCYVFAFWVDDNGDIQPIVLERFLPPDHSVFWRYDKDGIPHSCTKQDMEALMEYWGARESEVIESKMGEVAL